MSKQSVNVLFYIDSSKPCNYTRELSSALLSLCISHRDSASISITIVGHNLDFLRFLKTRLFDILGIFISALDLDVICLEMPELLVASPFYKKIYAINHAYENYAVNGTASFVFVDLDIVFLTPCLTSVFNLMHLSGCLISLAHECGSTGLNPYPAHNSGLIFFTIAQPIENLLASWLDISSPYRDLPPSTWGDQFTLTRVLQSYPYKILTLEKNYNARLHPVFRNSDFIWGCLHVVHNHGFSRGYIYSLLTSCSSATECNDHHSKITKVLNPLDGFNPRLISIHEDPSSQCFELCHHAYLSVELTE